jgi:drug/metabolite transporter (DMT)-like permease
MNAIPIPSDIQTRPMAAALCMIGAMVLLGFVDNFVATVAEEISIWQFLAVRASMAIPLICLMSTMGLGTMRPKRFWAVAVRSLLTAMGLMLYFGSLAFMPIAQSLAGLFTSPIFVLLISAFVFKQTIGKWRVIAVAIGFSGILLVLGIQDGAPGWIMMMPVAGGLIYAIGSMATRILCSEESTISMLAGIMTVQLIIGTLALVGLTIWSPVVPEGADGFLLRGLIWPIETVFPYIAMQAVISVAGVFLLIRAYQWGEASQVSVLEYSIMIFGPFFAWLFMGQSITPMMMAGIALIMVAGGIIAVRSKE